MGNVYGLIGKNINYSFSKDYFKKKFEFLGLDHSYENFDVNDLSTFTKILETPNLKGLNVTIPFKETVLEYLDSLSETAERIGAVNTIKIVDGKTEGHNTDWFGFRESLRPMLRENHRHALILGTGGAAKAVAYALRDLEICYRFVSRTDDELMHYNELSPKIMMRYHIIINCTPLGTFPDVNCYPEIPYHFLTKNHIVYDLVYNPEKSLFLSQAEQKGATIKNGYEMLEIQAEKSWEIWNS